MKTIAPALLLLLLATGCASITKGTTQTLVFELDPQDTRCTLSRDGDGEIGSINSRNNSVTVGKDKDDILVKCLAPGHEKGRSAGQDLPGLRAALYLAQEVGTLLGRGTLLLRALPAFALSRSPLVLVQT